MRGSLRAIDETAKVACVECGSENVVLDRERGTTLGTIRRDYKCVDCSYVWFILSEADPPETSHHRMATGERSRYWEDAEGVGHTDNADFG